MTAPTEREQRYIEALGKALGCCDGDECSECREGAEAVMAVADAELNAVALARNSVMRQRDEERRAKEGNIVALNAAIARATAAEAKVARVRALAAEWESWRGASTPLDPADDLRRALADDE